jgi:hypothetical protein
MTYKIVDWTGKQLFNKTFKDFDSAWEFIDSLETKSDFLDIDKVKSDYGYFEKNGDFINELWAIPNEV